MAKDLGDVAHYFLSAAKEKESCTLKTCHVLSIASMIPDLPPSFLTWNLALSIAREGKKVLILDAEKRLPTINFFIGPRKEIFCEGPIGILVLTAPFDLHCLTKLQVVERINLFKNLREAEDRSEIILINLPMKLTKESIKLASISSDEFLVFISPENGIMKENWGIFSSLEGKKTTISPFPFQWEEIEESIYNKIPWCLIHPTSITARSIIKTVKSILETESLPAPSIKEPLSEKIRNFIEGGKSRVSYQ